MNSLSLVLKAFFAWTKLKLKVGKKIRICRSLYRQVRLFTKSAIRIGQENKNRCTLCLKFYIFRGVAALSDSSLLPSARHHTVTGGIECPPKLHPFIQIQQVLATKNQDGDSHNAQLEASQTNTKHYCIKQWVTSWWLLPLFNILSMVQNKWLYVRS